MARRARFVRPAPRSMVWLGAGFAPTTVAASSAVLIGILNASALALRPFTIVRTRIVTHWESDQQAASEFVQGVFSMQVVTEVAAAGGVGNVPTPLIETNADYHVYHPLLARLRVIGSAAIGFDPGASTIDSKAMRKVGTDDQLVWVVENRAALGASLSMEGRVLVKLH